MSILAKSVGLKKRKWNEERMHEVERPYMMAIMNIETISGFCASKYSDMAATGQNCSVSPKICG